MSLEAILNYYAKDNDKLYHLQSTEEIVGRLSECTDSAKYSLLIEALEYRIKALPKIFYESFSDGSYLIHHIKHFIQLLRLFPQDNVDLKDLRGRNVFYWVDSAQFLLRIIKHFNVTEISNLDNYNYSPVVYYALEAKGDFNELFHIINVFLNYHCPSNFVDENNENILHFLARDDSKIYLARMFASKELVNQKSLLGKTPFEVALLHENFSLCLWIMTHVKTLTELVGFKEFSFLFFDLESKYKTDLATYDNCVYVFILLLDKDNALEEIHREQYVLATNSAKALLIYLMSRGISKACFNKALQLLKGFATDTNDPFRSSKIDLANYLFEHVDFKKFNWSQLHFSVFVGYSKLVTKALENSIGDLNRHLFCTPFYDKNPITPLHLSRGHDEIFTFLLSFGAFVTIKDYDSFDESQFYKKNLIKCYLLDTPKQFAEMKKFLDQRWVEMWEDFSSEVESIQKNERLSSQISYLRKFLISREEQLIGKKNILKNKNTNS